ncbi:MAG: tetratricopeptide repeat protein [Ignavibacteria bacterium]|nr:tetratricopeptide repeat protein [Ignavibacteria bacterium]
MKTLLLLLILTFSLGACSKAPWKSFAPAELKQRRPGLYAEDFAAQQKKYVDVTSKIKLAPDDIKSYCALAKVFMYEARVTGEHPYYYPAALACLDEAISKDKENPEALILKTSVLLSLHHFSEAKELAQRISNSTKGTAAVYGMLCDANVELGNYTEAVQAVDKMMNLRPGLEAYSRASYLREITGDNNGAIEAMKLAVQAGLPGTEDAAWTRVTLGNLFYHQGKIAEAEAQFLMARMERINYPFALAGLAMVYKTRHEFDAASALLDSAITMIPEVAFYEKKAEIEELRGNTTAVDSLLAAIEIMLDEDEQAGHINHADRALLYAKHSYKIDAAINHAVLEIKLRPNNITAQYAMAYTLFRNQRYQEAKEYITKALRMNSNDADMLLLASSIAQKLGNSTEHVKYSMQAKAANPLVVATN